MYDSERLAISERVVCWTECSIRIIKMIMSYQSGLACLETQIILNSGMWASSLSFIFHMRIWVLNEHLCYRNKKSYKILYLFFYFFIKQLYIMYNLWYMQKYTIINNIPCKVAQSWAIKYMYQILTTDTQIQRLIGCWIHL